MLLAKEINYFDMLEWPQFYLLFRDLRNQVVEIHLVRPRNRALAHIVSNLPVSGRWSNLFKPERLNGTDSGGAAVRSADPRTTPESADSSAKARCHSGSLAATRAP